VRFAAFCSLFPLDRSIFSRLLATLAVKLRLCVQQRSLANVLRLISFKFGGIVLFGALCALLCRRLCENRVDCRRARVGCVRS
jgi:hypothetical protein